ncbi:hypothetical protein BGM26_06030 [Bacillus sp. FJAT-29790]|uniref:CBO0543 family protein n=1 Tax=Bacillus sp. FJAT-29790 TaxID=1895002 RepID=UPI001C240230|nr:CBO0543 family protein [Bacillus sp. FJAT-29790]MBU8878547.1 hypothetical protein [Bacillus sp. FJAT-29790]
MNTAKHSINSNLPPLQKKQSSFKKRVTYFPTIVFAALLGTYLDLYFVEKKLYEFPVRPFPELFSINISFTLITLPLLTGVFLFIAQRLNRVGRCCLLVAASALTPVVEMYSEKWGFFRHTGSWNHAYSILGYLLFLIIIWHVFKWTNKGIWSEKYN